MKKYKKFYLESLLPKEPCLSRLKKVNILVSPILEIDEKTLYLGFKNPVNAHLFKPSYYLNSNETATCFCATLTVAKHIKKAWRIYAENFKLLKTDIKILKEKSFELKTDNLYVDYIQELLKNKLIHESVVIGKIDSINAFLKILYLKDTVKVDFKKLKKLFIELELHRLKHHLISVHNFQIFNKYLGKKKFNRLEIDLQPKTDWVGRYLGIENVEFKEKKFTIINLPWGQDLAYSIAKKLLLQNKNIKKLFIVGGVGCISEKVNIDDIFIANSSQDESGDEIKIDNEFEKIFTKDKKSYVSPSKMFSKKVVKGKLLCVNSSLGHKEDFSEESKVKGICAFDMESHGIMKGIKETKSKVKIFMIHYIMDLPLKGLGLGATYYNKKFLMKLFSNFNRGKYFCFDYILKHI